MSDMLALRWENNQLVGVEASVGRGKIRVDRCFVLEWPEGSHPSEQPQLAGSWLKEELRRHGVTAVQVTVALPREDAVVRPLDLPDAPDSELPELVRFQAATKSTVPLDRLCLDYLPLPKQPGAAGRTVLMATIPRPLADRIRAVVEAAGLELDSIGLAATGTTELIVREERRGAETAGERLIISRRGEQIEYSILSQRQLVFTHTARVSGTTPEQQNQAILAEVGRSAISLQRTIPNVKITRAWLLGTADEHPQLAELLAQRLSCEVRGAFDPLSSGDVELRASEVPDRRGRYAGAVGMLLGKSGGVIESIDFLHPRQPIVEKSDSKRKYLIAGVCAAVVIVGAAVRYWQTVKSLQGAIDNLNEKKTELTEFKELNKGTLEIAKTMEDWQKRNVSWLEEAGKIGEALGSREQMYVDSIHFQSNLRGPIANLRIEGFAKGRTDSDALDRRLVERNFVVKAHPMGEKSDDAEYPYPIGVDVDLVERKASHATP